MSLRPVVTFSYGKTTLDYELPEGIDWRVLQKALPAELPPQGDLVSAGLTELLGQLSRRLKSGGRVLLIVPDHTRKCGLPLLLPPLIDALEGTFNAKVEILIANGSHAPQPAEAISALLSPAVCRRVPVAQHSAMDEKELVYFGRTTFGTEIRLNRRLRECDFIVTVGGVLYHYFAGFGGGPKMLLPGVAAYETIRQNHSLTIDPQGGFNPLCREGRLEDNPVYQDLVQVLDFVENVLSLQVVLSPDGRFFSIRAGEIRAVQQEQTEAVKALYSLSLPFAADAVIADAGGFPSDVNLVQAHKAIHHAFQAVKPGGCLLVIAECSEGIGSATFSETARYGSSRHIAEQLRRSYRINGQTALSLREKAEKVRLILLSSLPREVVEQSGMIPASNPQEAAHLLRQYNEGKTGWVLRKANLYLPLVGEGDGS